MNKFGQRLKYLREEAGLSQQELSKKLDSKISATAIGYWELSKRIPNLDAAILLAQYFNVTLDYIAGLEDD